MGMLASDSIVVARHLRVKTVSLNAHVKRKKRYGNGREGKQAREADRDVKRKPR